MTDGPPPAPCTTPTLASDQPVDFTYSFVDANGHNNGNVAQITDNQAWPLTQTYTYDSLNRVATAQSLGTHSSAPGTCWAETYNYDAWGNLYSFGPNSTTQSAYIGCSQESGLSSSAATKNQLSTYTYDAAGNLITIPAVASYTYDAENHLVSAGGLNYSYDGDGKRVMKSNGILYWYGAGSDPLFESDTSGYQIFKHFYFNGMRVARQEGWAQGYWIDHYVTDALGDARFVYGYNGAWDVSDYYPFGGERPYQSQEGNLFKFTGKERDSESGLDNFGARYDSSQYGRFMTPDPIFITKHRIVDPQQWNIYAYVRNNPLNLTDPTGKDLWEKGCGKESGTCHKDYVGSWDKDHKNFTPTTIQSDKNGKFDGHNVTMDTSGIKVDGKYQGVFASGTSQTVVSGTGNLTGFQATFNGNCSGHCEATGTISALSGHSFSQLFPQLRGPNEKFDVFSGHEGEQYRGGNEQGPDIHISYLPNRDAQSAHFDWRFPFGSADGFAQHSKDFAESAWDTMVGRGDPPYNEVGP